jgi:hypothetical protein
LRVLGERPVKFICPPRKIVFGVRNTITTTTWITTDLMGEDGEDKVTQWDCGEVGRRQTAGDEYS